MICRKMNEHLPNNIPSTMDIQMWSLLQTNLAWIQFFPASETRKKKKKATKGNDVVMNYVLTIPTRHENFSRWVKSDNIQRARVTRASCSMKDPIDPIVIPDVSHRITFISASITYLGGLWLCMLCTFSGRIWKPKNKATY